MINFFRRIRRNLIQDSQFYKYLKYAVGEILLVVLGILIAFQINNWNDKKENKKKELSYISSIIEDIETDIEQSQVALEQLNQTRKGLDSLLLELSSEEIYLNSNKAYSLWMKYIGFEDFISNDRTLQLLKYSSGFEFITRKKASDVILTYDQNIKNYKFQSELISNILSNPQLINGVFDVISLEKSIHDSIPIPLLTEDKILLNQLYGNRKIWKMALNGATSYLEIVHESGKQTKNKLQEIYRIKDE